MSADPTGRRFTIRSGNTTAEISQVGAALRVLTVGGTDLVPRYADNLPTPAASGVVLVPWPNRVRDGRWTHDGQSLQLALTEPQLGNASHGLLRYTAYQLAHEQADAVTITANVVPQTGYPFHLVTEVTYALHEARLVVTHRIRNVGEKSAPVALGTHPYFCIGGTKTEDLTVHLDAATQFELDGRLLPGAEVPIDPAVDLRHARRVGDVTLNTAFSNIARAQDDTMRSTLTAPTGEQVEVWGGSGFEYMVLYTTDRYPGHELAIAIEPMTAPADAFNSGRGLRVLAPGETWTLEWGVNYTAG